MVRVLINVPKQVKRGEPFEVKLLISHPMESGQRRDEMGRSVPRDIINSFVCTYNGEDVLRAQLFPAIAANPFLSFSAVAQESGTLTMTFIDDHGVAQTETASVVVEE
jgi:sulfur-oxidizing protein SoxZ